MKMKQMIAWIMCCVLCLSACTAFAVSVDEDYEVIVTTYNDAVNDPGHAIELLSQMLSYYTKTTERKTALDTYMDAKMYYYYASARIEMNAGNYIKASEYLHKCGTFGHKTETYRSFAQGMLYKQAGYYSEALALLKEVQTDPEVAALCISAIEECEAAYKEDLLAKAALACKGGDHATALEYYTRLVELFPWDIAISMKQKECQGHGDPDPGVISLVNAYSVDANSISLEWQGTMPEYTVSWTMDWSDKGVAETLTTKETSCKLNNLKPGTMYRVTIGNGTLGVTADVETKTPVKYSEKDSTFKWMGTSTMYRFSRAQYINTGKPGYFMLEFNPTSVKDKSIVIYEDPIENSCVLFVFPTLGIPASMNGMPYEILLHVEGKGTLSATGVFGDAYVCANKDDRICVLLDTLLDDAAGRFKDLAEVNYRLDVVMDNALVVQTSGKFN